MTALTPWTSQEDQTVNTIVEISQGSQLKIEWDVKRELFMLDRVEPGIFAKPVNYGYIPGTLDEDGDPLDTLIVSPEPIPMGVLVEGRVIGVLNFEDDGEMDHKVVVVPADDRSTGDAIKNLDDLGEAWKNQVAHHFAHYKDLKKPGTTNVQGWGDTSAAEAIIQECIQRADETVS
ncbi:inorganic diphosphatase [bacterium]|nr:MAG: inorganic diphosphatase [bacterium]